MGRPWRKHIDSEELDALVPSPSESSGAMSPHSSADLFQMQLHVISCTDCHEKFTHYQQLVNGLWDRVPESTVPRAECPTEDDVNWAEVAAGLWPELKARQLITHAAVCDYCGSRLRAAVRERRSREIQDAARPTVSRHKRRTPAHAWSFSSPPAWFPVAVAMILMVVWWSAKPFLVSRPLSGIQVAKLAVRTHQQHVQGNFPLGLHTDSRETLNDWLHSKTGLVVPKPGSMAVSDEQPSYRLEGAQLLPVGSQTGAYISYESIAPDTAAGIVSLMVTPDSAAIAGGGVEVDFPKVRFHYSAVDGYKVVTWSVHGMTYALVSSENLHAQRSCLVCHMSTKDPALHRTPTFSSMERNLVPLWQ